MNRRLLTCAIVIAITASLSAQSIWKEPKNYTWKSATGAEQYERLLWKAVKDKNWLAVESHIASNFVYSDSTGTKDKAQRVADLKAMSLADVALSDTNVTASGSDAIVTYVMSGTRYMSLWQQQKSGWILVAMSAVPVAR